MKRDYSSCSPGLRFLRFTRTLALLALLPGFAFAQDYPGKAIRFIVPYPPGGASDVVARLIGGHMSETWKQPVVIENRAGTNGMIALTYVAQAAPDGYTLLMTNVGPSAINPSIYAKVPYDAIRDFVPVSLTNLVPLMLVVNSSLGVSTMADLVARAKASPGTLTYGTAAPAPPGTSPWSSSWPMPVCAWNGSATRATASR